MASNRLLHSPRFVEWGILKHEASVGPGEILVAGDVVA